MTDDTRPASPRSSEGMSVLTLHGELDYSHGEQLSATVDAALAAAPAVLAVDLSDVTFADSFALRVLVLAHQRMRTAGGSLILVGPLTIAVQRLLEATATDKHFTIAQDMAAAEAVADVLLGHGTGRS
ncbi:STAS domain-containing protein [Kitasatospora aureofaciens]|uniref:STAS domain-containing protein n=1 Tax=Kitasatospora aureofaciens TaxID=1894 RepID=UPI0033CA852F